MKIEFEQGKCIVTKEACDRKYYPSGWATAESQLLFTIKKKLVAMGFDVIKKRAWKDGHLVDDTLHYIRTRKFDGNWWYAYNMVYCIQGLEQDWNNHGRCYLTVVSKDDHIPAI